MSCSCRTARRGRVEAAVARILSHLARDVRGHLRVAPDPAQPKGDSARLRLSERSTLSRADRVMRLFKYFATYVDLVVTNEGWLHAPSRTVWADPFASSWPRSPTGSTGTLTGVWIPPAASSRCSRHAPVHGTRSRSCWDQGRRRPFRIGRERRSSSLRSTAWAELEAPSP